MPRYVAARQRRDLRSRGVIPRDQTQADSTLMSSGAMINRLASVRVSISAAAISQAERRGAPLATASTSATTSAARRPWRRYYKSINDADTLTS